MKIYIDRCHGCRQDRGANFIFNEEVCSDKMIDLVVPKLQSLGHNVLAQRPSGNLTVQQFMAWRCQQANAWGADVFISNHNNGGGGEGAEVYTYNGEQLIEAKRYLQYILDHGGKTHDGTLTHESIPGAIKNGNGLAVIKGTSMKAMLLENFYVDTQSDCNFFSNNIEMFANALVYGITGIKIESSQTTEIDEMSYEGKQEVDNKITVYAHITNADVYYKYYYELNGKWTTVTDWQDFNRCSFIPKESGDYKVVCHVKFKNNKTEIEDAYNYVTIHIKDKTNIYEMKVNGQYYGQTYYEDIAQAVKEQLEKGVAEITLVKK
jgi:hypothetical protein